MLGIINAAQGIGMMLASIGFVAHAISLRQLCGCVTLALFVAASAYITDGVLAWRSRVGRTMGLIVTGPQARTAGVFTIRFGLSAMLLGAAGVLYLWAGPLAI